MKKITLVVSALLAAVLVFAVVSPALAAGPQQGGPGTGDPEEWGQGGFPRRGARGAGDGLYLNQDREMMVQMDGLLEDLIHSQLAEALAMDLAVLNERLDAGETMFDLAADQGYDLDAFSDLMVGIRMDALEAAVESGILSQDQADWISTRGFGSQGFGQRENCLSQ